MPNKDSVTTKQSKAIPKLLAAPTYEKGCRAAGISKATFYGWLQNDVFRAEFERQRDELAAYAFGQLSQNTCKAIEVLVRLLDDPDKRLRRLSAKDILDQFLKHRELRELETRITALEQRLVG